MIELQSKENSVWLLEDGKVKYRLGLQYDFDFDYEREVAVLKRDQDIDIELRRGEVVKINGSDVVGSIDDFFGMIDAAFRKATPVGGDTKTVVSVIPGTEITVKKQEKIASIPVLIEIDKLRNQLY